MSTNPVIWRNRSRLSRVNPTVRILIAILFALLLGSFLSAEKGPVEKLIWLTSANPVTDAYKALKNGDKRLKAVYGYVLSIPGTKYEQFDELKDIYGISPIDGTSDNFQSKKHKNLNNLANDYARKYNEIIIGSAK